MSLRLNENIKFVLSEKDIPKIYLYGFEMGVVSCTYQYVTKNNDNHGVRILVAQLLIDSEARTIYYNMNTEEVFMQ